MHVGMIAYAVKQGLGYLAKSFFDNGVVDDVLIVKHSSPRRPTQPDWYPSGTPMLTRRPFREKAVDEFLERVDVVMFFETPFDWSFPNLCRTRGVKTVLIPMYEWFPKELQDTHPFDLIIAPSLLDQDYFRNSVFIPVPVETKYWKQRYKAIKFLHNAGNVGCKEHKGTRQLLEAIPLIKTDAQVTVRAQDPSILKSIVDETYHGKLPENLILEPGEIPYDNLWDGYDVLVAPEKFNGLSLPLAEARVAGMLVMTTNRYPANTWLPNQPLIPVSYTIQSRHGRGYLEFEESIVDPEDIAKTIDEWYDKNITNYSKSGWSWGQKVSWRYLKPVYLEELQKLCQS
jgi:hypothetical protein